jgi:capsular polysaccharide transport system permease protein
MASTMLRAAVRERGLAAVLQSEGRVIWALMLREFHSRHGQWGLRFLNTFTQTALIVALLSAVFTLIGEQTPLGMEAAAFVLSGFVTYKLFMRSYGQVPRGTKVPRVVHAFPQVTLLDTVFTANLVYFLTMVVVVVVIGSIIRLLEWGPWPITWVGLFCDMILAALLGLGFGLFMRWACAMLPLLNGLNRVLRHAMHLISGIFFMPAMIPEPYRDYFMWNPVVHITEAARVSWFGFADTYGSLSYVGWWILALLCVGLLGERAMPQRRKRFEDDDEDEEL